MLIMMFMLMMLMMMQLEQVSTLFCSDTAMLTSTLNYIECQGQALLYCGPMDGSFAECSVEDKPVDCMCKGTCPYVGVLPVLFSIGNEQSGTVHKSGVLPVQACRRPQSCLRKLQRRSRRTGVNAQSTCPQAKCRSCCRHVA